MNILYISAFSLSAFFVAGAAMALEPNLATADHFYYAVLTEYTGPVVQGLGAAGLLAAVMSSTDALLVALSASVSHDIPNSLNMNPSEKMETRLGSVIVWVGALSAGVVAFNPPGIIGIMTTLVAGFAASGLFPALAIGTWWKRANAKGPSPPWSSARSRTPDCTSGVMPVPYSRSARDDPTRRTHVRRRESGDAQTDRGGTRRVPRVPQ